MKPFRPSKGTSQSSRPGVLNYVMQEGSGYTWLQNWLTDLANVTRFRIIPAIEDGQELAPLNPEATVETPLQETIGEVFYVAEIVNMLGSKRLTYISAANADASGVAPPGDWSPTRITVHNLRKKIEEQIKRKARHLPTDIPKAWYNLAEGKYPFSALPYPNELFLVQCMAIEVNGHKRKNLETNKPEWVAPAILALPSSATTHFFDAIRSKATDGPLSTDNNLFGDFCTCDKGCLLQVKKMLKKAQQTSGSSFTYGIYKQQLLPLAVNKAASLWKPWETILRIPTVEQTIQWLFIALGAEAVAFGLRGTPYEGYIPEECQGTADSIKDPVSDEDLELEVSQFKQGFIKDVKGQTDAPPFSPSVDQSIMDDDQLPFDTPFEDLPLADGSLPEAPVDDPPLKVDIAAPPPSPSGDGVDVRRYQESLKRINESMDTSDSKASEPTEQKI